MKDVKNYYDGKAEGYDGRIRADVANRMLGKLTWNWLKENLKGSEELRILDAGGGTGRWAIPLAKLGHNVIILDISQEMLRIAESKAGKLRLNNLIKTKCGNMEKTQFSDEYFDFVLCEGDAFGLTPHPQKAVYEFSRILRPFGKLSLSIINYYKMLFFNREVVTAKGLSEYLTQAKTVREPFNGPYVRTFRPETVYSMMEKAGLLIERTAPRFVLFDTLEEDDKEKWYREIYKLETKFSSNPHLTSLGYHVMILACKKSRTLDK